MAACALLGGCKPSEPAASGPAVSGRSYESFMRNVRLRQVEKGRLEVDLFAEEAWLTRGSKWLHARGVRAVYYPENGPAATLFTRQARYDTKNNILFAAGDVRLKTEDATLETSDLTWDGGRGRVTTESPVRLVKGSNIMSGRGLEADPGLERIVIKEDVKIIARDTSALKPLVEPGE